MRNISFFILLIFSMLLVSCSDDISKNETLENDLNDSDDGEVNGQPIEISIMTHFFGSTPPSSDNQVEKAVEEETNTKLDIQWASAQNYVDKFNVAIASGELADLVLVPDVDILSNPVFVQAAQQEAFWDITPYIEDYPNLQKYIPESAWELTQINGANFAMPRPRPSESDWFFIFRKDWLENVGLEVPTTVDELYEVMRAFTEEDPDQNGKDDTTGFTSPINDQDMGDFGLIEDVFTGVNGEWAKKDGKLVYKDLLPEIRDALEFITDAYKEGLIPEDFASITSEKSREIFMASKAGVKSDNTGGFKLLYDEISKSNSDFEMTDLTPAINIDGYNPKATGFNGGLVIPKTVPEDKMKEILTVIDKWMEDDIFSLHQGIEGIHYTIGEDGEKVVDSDQVEKDGISNYNQIVYVADPYGNAYKPEFPEELKVKYSEIQDEREKTSVAPVAVGLTSESSNTYLPELKKDITDLKVKIILGHETITAWDNFIEDLKNDNTMQQVTKEINEVYESRQ
ncbi:extracellular solute-binding protein [Gracilibacillus timonensis]|uniref:extracellular solute-binding protein n=1 Tax=Gracilibacillus timonensis TaxID=1816696 RepID=UPI000826ADBE|nr:extracellular solute-binding protein [Gracilibacillus timonensis]